jgi:hypothetical protein
VPLPLLPDPHRIGLWRVGLFPARGGAGDRRGEDYQFTTESGRSFTTHFCPTCGSNVLWSLGLSPELIGIAAGSFDPPSFWFPLSREIFTRSAAPFVHTDLPDKHATTASYAPVQADPAALRGA